MNPLQQALRRRAGLSVCGAIAALIACAVSSPRAADSTGEGVALAIVYDTSSSMLQTVPDAAGKRSSKQDIAARALKGVIDRLEGTQGGSGDAKAPLQVGLLVFDGDQARWAVKMGTFSSQPFRTWLKEHNRLQRGTPLGEAVRVAGEAVLRSNLPRKHVLVITDGVNTRGSDPTVTIPKLQREAAQRNARLGFHFIAFDINAGVFTPVKQLGATVVGAADEAQLNTQLEFILAKKILLEDEELPSTTPKQD